MATQFGNNSIASGHSVGWFFVKPAAFGTLPVLQVLPLSSSATDPLWFRADDGYTFLNQLGVSTIWSQLNDEGDLQLYFMVVSNNSNNPMRYAFVEADL